MENIVFDDFYKVPNIKFDISKLKSDLKRILIKKKFNSLGIKNFGAISLNQIPGDTYFEEVYNILRKNFKLGRVRILLKEPRSTLSWHRDPEPRLHIPIVTNLGCRMVIENIAKHMPADGTVTITNNTKYHNFFNGGEQERIHLVACVLEDRFKNYGN